MVSYLEVTTAQSTALADERAAVDILRRRMTASVSLIKALGGGWSSASLPSVKAESRSADRNRPVAAVVPLPVLF